MAITDPAASPLYREVILPSSENGVVPRPLADLQQDFAIHPLTMDDFLHRNQRAKFETFDHYRFLVWHCPQRRGRPSAELHFVIMDSRLALVATAQPENVPTWREFFFGTEFPATVHGALVQIFRKLVRATEDRLAELSLDVAQLERRILDGRSNPQEILGFKRAVREFGMRAHSANDALADAAENLQFSGEDALLLRRTTDRFQRLLANHDLLNTQLIALFDVYWGSVGTETNTQLKRLTVMTTLCLPVALWSGFFGMNFTALPFDQAWFFGLAMFLMGASVALVLVFLRRQGLVGPAKHSSHSNGSQNAPK